MPPLYNHSKLWYNRKEFINNESIFSYCRCRHTRKKLSPKTSTSSKYKHWISNPDLKRCKECEENHGKIWLIPEKPSPNPPIHPWCRCLIKIMQAITAGSATINGKDGADWTIKYQSCLPNYYVSKVYAQQQGWKPGKWPSNFIPDKMISAGIYYNDNLHLPEANGRIWYEADINYISGKRNSQRILWSNDGLMFVTYDHYKTFYEIA